MVLTLEVLGEQAVQLGDNSRREFNAIGGTIGRLPDNDWVFADPYVSGRHALIRYLNGKYFIEDTSTNGVFINSPDKRLSRTQPQQLRNGDVLYIDAYQIRVAIERDPASPKRNDLFTRFRDDSAPAQASRRAAAPAEDRTASLVMHEAEDQGTEWFGTNDMREPEAAPAPRARQELPRPVAPPPRAHLGRAAQSPAQSPAMRPVAGAASARVPAGSDDSHLSTLFAAAGIEGLEPTGQTAQTLGDVLRAAVGGVMEALRAREHMKDELRMRGTNFKAAHNNPLKFSANVDDAFHNLLVKHNPAYLEPADAFEDAFRDLHDHQAATLVAMRLAFESMLAHFDPERLQEDFDRQTKKGSILGVPAKLRYWELYRDKYGAVAKDAEKGFRMLFGDEFAKAYEEQLERMRQRG